MRYFDQGAKILDVGAGSGTTGAYLEKRYGVEVRSYEVLPPGENKYATMHNQREMGAALRIFNGRRLPDEGDAAHDTVIFNAVLHHAAQNTFALLGEAARIAKRYILLVEDLELGDDSTFRNGTRASVSDRNRLHEPKGIFRTHGEWTILIESRRVE